jgi:RNA polymerase sigma-70 factor (ECF subfamily)
MELVRHAEVAGSRLEGDGWLWTRSLAGDGRAFGGLFDRHRDRVFRHACRLAHTRQDAEDLVASAFLELWRRRSKVQLVDGSVLPWLLATTTNLGRNASRAQRRYRQLLGRLPRVEEQPDTAEVALDGHALGVDERLRAGLLGLRKTDAQLIALVALEGYPVGAAAELLGLSEPAARARLQRVRIALREEFGGDAATQQTDIQGGRR